MTDSKDSAFHLAVALFLSNNEMFHSFQTRPVPQYRSFVVDTDGEVLIPSVVGL
jgi:hypothetical protein